MSLDWVVLDTLRQPQYVEDDLNDAPLVDANGKKRTPLYLLQSEELKDTFFFTKAATTKEKPVMNHGEGENGGDGGAMSSRSSAADDASSTDEGKGITHGILLTMHKLGKPQAWSESEFEKAGLLVRHVLLRQQALFGSSYDDEPAPLPLGQGQAGKKGSSGRNLASSTQLRGVNERSLKLLAREGAGPMVQQPRYARLVSRSYGGELARFDVVPPQKMLATDGDGHRVATAAAPQAAESTSGGGDIAEGFTDLQDSEKQPTLDNMTALSVADLDQVQGDIISTLDLMQSKRQLFVPKESRVVFEEVHVAGTEEDFPPVFAVRYERPEPPTLSTSSSLKLTASFSSAPSAAFPAVPQGGGDGTLPLEVAVAPVGDVRAVGLVDKYEWERDKLKDDFDLVSPRASIHESAELAMSDGGSASSRSSTPVKKKKRGVKSIRRISTFVGRNMLDLAQSDDDADEGGDHEDGTEKASTTGDISRSASIVRKGTLKGTPATEAKAEEVSPAPSVQGKPPLPSRSPSIIPSRARRSLALDDEEEEQEHHPVLVFGSFLVHAVALDAATVAAQRDDVQQKLTRTLATYVEDGHVQQPVVLAKVPQASGGTRVSVTFSQQEDFTLHPPRCMFGLEGEDEIEESTEGIFYDLLYSVEDALAELEREERESADDDAPPRLPAGHVLRDGLLTPAPTPLRWRPAEQEEYHMAPFLRMRVEKMDNNQDEVEDKVTKHNDDSGDDDDDVDESEIRRQALLGGEPDATTSAPQHVEESDSTATVAPGTGSQAQQATAPKASHLLEAAAEEAARVRAAEDERRREDAIERLKAISRAAHSDRLLEQYLAKSRTNIAPPGPPWLVLSQVPMRMEGVTAAVARWLRASKKGGDSLDALRAASEKLAADRQSEKESFAPSFFRLRSMLRLMNFGSLLAAMMTKQATLMPSGGKMGGAEGPLGSAISEQLEEMFARERQQLQRQIAARSRGPLVDWMERVDRGEALLRSASRQHPSSRQSTKKRSSPAQGLRAAGPQMPEAVLAQDAPFFQHFLPTLSSRPASQMSAATRFAALRRHPRDAQLTGGLSAPPPSAALSTAVSSGSGSAELRGSRKGHDASRAMFASLQNRSPTPTASSLAPLLEPRRRASSTTPMSSLRSRVQEVVAIQRSAVQQLQPLRFDALHRDD